MNSHIAIRISCDFMQNCHGFSDDVIPAQPLQNSFTTQRFVITIQIFNELVCFMSAKSFVCLSNIFEATRFAIFDISKIDVMFYGKMLSSILKKISHAHLD